MYVELNRSKMSSISQVQTQHKLSGMGPQTFAPKISNFEPELSNFDLRLQTFQEVCQSFEMPSRSLDPWMQKFDKSPEIGASILQQHETQTM